MDARRLPTVEGAQPAPQADSLGCVTEPAPDPLGSLHGRLNDFTSENQQLWTIPRDTEVADALVIMRREGFSQLPVMHNERLVGVFSYRSFARRLLELNLGAGVDVLRISVADFVGDLPLMPPDQDIEAAIAPSSETTQC